MKLKVIIAIILVLTIVIYVIRVMKVNHQKQFPVTMEYALHEEVPIENDYFDDESEKMNGYSVRVSTTELLTADEFFGKYNKENLDEIASEDHVLLVRAVFRNEANDYGENAGINLHQYILQESSYICFPARDIYGVVNGFDAMAFSLKEDSEMEITIPFKISSEHIDINRIKNRDPELVISLYPHKKVIHLIEA